MKNELGIEVCCENCSFYHMGCKRKIEAYCKDKAFVPSRVVYEQRIKELQAEVRRLTLALTYKKEIRSNDLPDTNPMKPFLKGLEYER